MLQRVFSLIVMAVLGVTATSAAHAQSPLDALARIVNSAGDGFVERGYSRPHAVRPIASPPPVPHLRPADPDAAAVNPPVAPATAQVASAAPAVPGTTPAGSAVTTAAAPTVTPAPTNTATVVAPPAKTAAQISVPASTVVAPANLAASAAAVAKTTAVSSAASAPASPAIAASAKNAVLVAQVPATAPAPVKAATAAPTLTASAAAKGAAAVPTPAAAPAAPTVTTLASLEPTVAAPAKPAAPSALDTAKAAAAASKPAVVSEATTSCAIALAAFGVKATPAIAPTEGGCRVASPVNLTATGDIAIMPKALVDCATAATLTEWLQDVVAPKAQAMLGAQLTEVRILNSYNCRTVDGIAGAALSEHSRGKAIDIGSFKVGNRVLTVGAKDLTDTEQAFFDAVRASACGPFTTVLGPGADQYHTDNLHLDTQERQTAGPSRGLYCQ